MNIGKLIENRPSSDIITVGIDQPVRDAVAILVENSPRFFEVCWAAQRAGLYYTPISTHLTAEEAAYIIDNSDSRVLFSSAVMAETARPLAPLTTGLAARFMTGGDIPGYEHLEDAIASGIPGVLGIHIEGPFLNPAKKGISPNDNHRNRS